MEKIKQFFDWWDGEDTIFTIGILCMLIVIIVFTAAIIIGESKDQATLSSTELIFPEGVDEWRYTTAYVCRVDERWFYCDPQIITREDAP